MDDENRCKMILRCATTRSIVSKCVYHHVNQFVYVEKRERKRENVTVNNREREREKQGKHNYKIHTHIYLSHCL